MIIAFAVLYILISLVVLVFRATDHLTGRVVEGEVVKPDKPATLTLRITATSLLWPLLWIVLLVRENTTPRRP